LGSVSPSAVEISHKEKFLEYIFEYACQVIEYLGSKPVETPATLRNLMNSYAEELIRNADEESALSNQKVVIDSRALEEIPLEILKEYNPLEYDQIIQERVLEEQERYEDSYGYKDSDSDEWDGQDGWKGK
jgi:hypothetical protein